jgi:hypothetical protein
MFQFGKVLGQAERPFDGTAQKLAQKSKIPAHRVEPFHKNLTHILQ